MHISAGGPYPNQYPSYLDAACSERRQLRSAANAVCWTALIGILLMYVISALCAQYLRVLGFTFTKSSFSGLPPVLYYLIVSVQYSVGLALPAFIYFAARHMPFSEGLPFRRAGVGNVALYIFFGCMVCMLANYPANAVSQILQSFGFRSTPPEMPLNNDPRVLLLYAVNVIIIPPLVEETMFRGVILQSLRRYGDGFAIVISAILFGMYHGNFIQMVFAFLCGLVMGFAVVRTNSLLPSIVIHFINNSVSLAVELVTRFYGQSMGNYVNNILSLTIVALGLIALVVLTVRHKLFTRRPSGSCLAFSSRIWAAFTNFGAFAFLLYGLVSSINALYGRG